jgi:hypothetical protein
LDSQSRREKAKGLTPNTKMYYTKVLFGVSSGFLTGIIFVILSVSPGWWFLFLITSLLICTAFVRIGLGISTSDVDQKRLFLSGTFTFVILFIVASSLGWMFLFPLLSPL